MLFFTDLFLLLGILSVIIPHSLQAPAGWDRNGHHYTLDDSNPAHAWDQTTTHTHPSLWSLQELVEKKINLDPYYYNQLLDHHQTLRSLPLQGTRDQLARAVVQLRREYVGDTNQKERFVRETNNFLKTNVLPATYEYIKMVWNGARKKKKDGSLRNIPRKVGARKKQWWSPLESGMIIPETQASMVHSMFHDGAGVSGSTSIVPSQVVNQPKNDGPFAVDHWRRTLRQLFASKPSEGHIRDDYYAEVAEHPAFQALLAHSAADRPQAIINFLNAHELKKQTLRDFRRELEFNLGSRVGMQGLQDIDGLWRRVQRSKNERNYHIKQKQRDPDYTKKRTAKTRATRQRKRDRMGMLNKSTPTADAELQQQQQQSGVYPYTTTDQSSSVASDMWQDVDFQWPQYGLFPENQFSYTSPHDSAQMISNESIFDPSSSSYRHDSGSAFHDAGPSRQTVDSFPWQYAHPSEMLTVQRGGGHAGTSQQQMSKSEEERDHVWQSFHQTGSTMYPNQVKHEQIYVEQNQNPFVDYHQAYGGYDAQRVPPYFEEYNPVGTFPVSSLLSQQWNPYATSTHGSNVDTAAHWSWSNPMNVNSEALPQDPSNSLSPYQRYRRSSDGTVADMTDRFSSAASLTQPESRSTDQQHPLL